MTKQRVSSRTSSRNVAENTRRAKAVEMRIEGATFQQIADELGYHDAATVHRAVTKAMAEAGREGTEELLTLELARLDRMQLALARRAAQGDDQAVNSTLRIMDRRAKYLGLDDFEARIAAAAEHQMAVANVQVGWLYQTMSAILARLNLTEEQAAIAPTVIVEELEALEGTQ